MTQLIMPQNANSLGITFGGQVGLPDSTLQFPTMISHHDLINKTDCCRIFYNCSSLTVRLQYMTAAKSLPYVHV